MIFSELYSVYYNTVAKILQTALQGELTEGELRRIVHEHAFSESVLTILPAVRTGKWPLLREDMTPVLRHPPTMPLTLLQKRWLKSLTDDPRLRLFGVELPDLEGVKPLFTRADYKIYDRYTDGDPFTDETYIRHFRLLLDAVRRELPVEITMVNRKGKEMQVRFFPTGLEYSMKDDKFRVLAEGCRYDRFNLGRITSCRYYEGSGPRWMQPKREQKREVTLLVTDRRNALERVMLHFAHFEKQAERLAEGRYRLRIQYYENDETEMVIRILSFGPNVQVTEPRRFVELMKDRLRAQKSCGLR